MAESALPQAGGGNEGRVSATMEKMAHGGEAMGRLPDGRVIFVGGALPGESVVAVEIESHERYGRGILEELPRQTSPDRIIHPRCEHFGTWPSRGHSPGAYCGGCHWQHVEYRAQLDFKADVVADALRRIGGIAAPRVEATIGMRDPWHYRNRIRMVAETGKLGFVAADGQSHCPIETCHIAHQAAAGLTGMLQGDVPDGLALDMRVGGNGSDLLLALTCSDEMIDAIEIESRADVSIVLVREDGSTELAAGRPYFEETLCGRRFIVPAQSFFQVNSRMAEELVAVIAGLLPDDISLLADVHSGVGTFGILLAEAAHDVVTIESDPTSVGAAIENAAGLDNITLLEADAAEGLSYLDRGPDVALVDPPRTGLDRETVRLLAEHVGSTICYVSCEPATLARDIRQLTAAGWELEVSQPIDMFPQTYHVESVSLLERR